MFWSRAVVGFQPTILYLINLQVFNKSKKINFIYREFRWLQTNKGKGNGVDNAKLITVNKILREHPVEIIGARLRESMTAMKPIV